MVVGNALCRPHATNLVGTFAKDFHLPYLVLVGNCNALAAITITVFFYKATNEFDSLTRRCATHKCYALKFLDLKHSLAVDKCIGARKSSFANGKLLFV